MKLYNSKTGKFLHEEKVLHANPQIMYLVEHRQHLVLSQAMRY